MNAPQLLDHPVECDSSYEADFVYRALLCPVVSDLMHQPFKVTVTVSGVAHTMTVDYLLTLLDGHRVAIEVKRRAKIAEYASLFDAVAPTLRQREIYFAVADETSIRAENGPWRAKLAKRYAKKQFDPLSCQRVINVIAQQPAGVAIGSLTESGIPKELIYHLIFTKQITTGRRLLLDSSALLSVVTPSEIGTHVDQCLDWLGLELWGEQRDSKSDGLAVSNCEEQVQ